MYRGEKIQSKEGGDGEEREEKKNADGGEKAMVSSLN